MKLYFEDANENSRLIAECQNETEVIQNIHKFHFLRKIYPNLALGQLLEVLLYL